MVWLILGPFHQTRACSLFHVIVSCSLKVTLCFLINFLEAAFVIVTIFLDIPTFLNISKR